MATRILLSTQRVDGEGPQHYLLQDDFDAVLNQVYPSQQPSSALEYQANMTYTKTDGNRVAINPSLIGTIEENYEED